MGTATYRKTKSGEWVAYGSVEDIHQGDEVVIVKKSGQHVRRMVAYVGKTFSVDGRDMCYGYLESYQSTTHYTHSAYGSYDYDEDIYGELESVESPARASGSRCGHCGRATADLEPYWGGWVCSRCADEVVG